MMDIDQLTEILACTKEALTERRKLARLHDAQIKRIHNGSMSRARTTTYNAAASISADRAISFENRIKRLVLGDN